MRVLASHNSLFDPHDPFITASTSFYEPPLHRSKTINRLPSADTVEDIPKRSQFSKMTSLIFSLLILFALFSSTQCHSRSLNDTGQTLISFDSGYIVHSIATYGNILAVENGEAITVFRLNRTDNNETVGHHKIYEVDLTSESGDIGPSLLELKIVSANTLLFCTQTACRVCNFAEGTQNECTNYSLELPNSKVKSVKANLLNDERLIIRTIRSPKGLTSIYMLDPRAKEPIKLVSDSAKQGITQNTVVFAFGSNKHTYFVGSSKKVDVPWSMVNQGRRQVRMDIRMSRVCNLDGTSNFESRIDIALSCKGLDDGYFNSFYHIAKAASLSNDGKRLLVAMQNGTTTPTNTVICEYDLSELQKTFEDTWTQCQAIQDANAVSSTCKALSESSIVSDPKCFLYSWEKQWRYPICERFNKNAYNKTFDNCDLASSELNVDRYGWLENYKPVLGEMVAMFENGTDDDVVGVKESFEGEALFLTYETGTIKRIRKGSFRGQPLWSTNTITPLGPMSLEMHANSMALLYTNNNQVKSLKVTCSELYEKCGNISWNDPLNCGWCAEVNGSGYAFAFEDTSACPTGQKLKKICPPMITEISMEGGKYTIVGKGFSSIRNLSVLACDRKCDIILPMDTVIRCSSHIHNMCPISLMGQLGDLNSFTLMNSTHVPPEGTSEITPGEEQRNTHSKMIRVFGFIVVVVLLLGTLVCVWHSYRKYSKRISAKLKNTEKGQHKYKSVSSSVDPTFVDSSFSGHFHLNDSGELDQSRIHMLKHIGDGNSARVHLAELDLDGEMCLKIAVKTIYNLSFEFADIMREIDLISRCSHKNIVEFVGYYKNHGGVHIVTEYMAGGDLHNYLQDPRNKPTIGDAFNYCIQICEGMEYLTKQHIIHRDLAARNCMLDEEKQIVKISDFGLCRISNVDYEYISENHYQKLPFRWTAIECLGTNGKFSEKSDVWSFGVVIWEIFARNLQPYGDLDLKGVRQFLQNGMRLEIPHDQCCPDVLYQNVMVRCWDESPSNRPTFSQLKIEIERILWELSRKSRDYLSTEYETPISAMGSLRADKDSPVTTPV